MKTLADRYSELSMKLKVIRKALSHKSRYKAYILKFFMYVLLLNFAFVFLYPYIVMLVTSVKTYTDLNDITINWIPRTIKIENYLLAFNIMDYMKYFKNTVFVVSVATMGHVLSCSFIGYGLARYQFTGKKVLFLIVIIALIVPVQTIIVPLYMIYANLKWLNTYMPILVPTFFGYGLKGALFIFIFRQFYMGLPKELEESATIDGCGFFRTYWNIVLPVAKSAFLVTFVLSIVWHWNDFYEPSIYTKKIELLLLPSRISNIIEMVDNPPIEMFLEMGIPLDEMAINRAVLMASILLVIIPLIIAFLFLQKKFVQGVERTGLAGD
jgi:multiple sugar transport system permease protein